MLVLKTMLHENNDRLDISEEKISQLQYIDTIQDDTQKEK